MDMVLWVNGADETRCEPRFGLQAAGVNIGEAGMWMKVEEVYVARIRIIVVPHPDTSPVQCWREIY